MRTSKKALLKVEGLLDYFGLKSEVSFWKAHIHEDDANRSPITKAELKEVKEILNLILRHLQLEVKRINETKLVPLEKR